MYIRRNSLYIVCATKFNISPAFAIELLTRYTNNVMTWYIDVVIVTESPTCSKIIVGCSTRSPSGSTLFSYMNYWMKCW